MITWNKLISLILNDKYRNQFHDIKQLLHVLHRLRDHGNTIVVIEHNLDVIKTADWIIDLGPEGGDGGGEIIATGTPEQVAKHKTSYTGKYLAPVLKKHRKVKNKPLQIDVLEEINWVRGNWF